MREAMPDGNEQLDPLAGELANGILEYVARGIAGEQYGARLTNNDRGVCRVREDSFQGRRECVDGGIDRSANVYQGRPDGSSAAIRGYTYCELAAADSQIAAWARAARRRRA